MVTPAGFPNCLPCLSMQCSCHGHQPRHLTPQHFSFVCIYVYTCMGKHMCTYMYVCSPMSILVEARGCFRYHAPFVPCLIFFFLRQGLSLNIELTILAWFTGSWALEMWALGIYLCPPIFTPNAEVTDECCCAWLLWRFQGSELRSSCLCSRHFTTELSPPISLAALSTAGPALIICLSFFPLWGQIFCHRLYF